MTYGGELRFGERKRLKDVQLWRKAQYIASGKSMANYESNFTRALRSLERRGLLARRQEPGRRPSWTVTDTGMAETRKFKDDDYGRLVA